MRRLGGNGYVDHSGYFFFLFFLVLFCSFGLNTLFGLIVLRDCRAEWAYGLRLTWGHSYMSGSRKKESSHTRNVWRS